MAKRKQIKTRNLDNIFRDVCYKELGRRCEYCGADGVAQVHHIYSRKNFGVRFSTVNVAMLCPLHHSFSTEFSAHQTPLIFSEWLRDHRAKDILEGLKIEAHIVVRAYEIDREALLENLKTRLN